MSKPYVAIVGGQSLIGREIATWSASGILPARVGLIGVDRKRSAPSPSRTASRWSSARSTRTTSRERGWYSWRGSTEASRKAYHFLSRAKPTPAAIDLTGGLEDAQRAVAGAVRRTAGYSVPEAVIHVVAHPGAIALAMLLTRLHAVHPMRSSVVQIFEPASERGQRGLEELAAADRQPVACSSRCPKGFTTRNSGFNMLARYGEEAPQALEAPNCALSVTWPRCSPSRAACRRPRCA